jgi:glycosyltransferase involved in cell wall biosynthesis
MSCYERRVAAGFDASFVVAEADRRELRLNNIHVIPNGVDTDAFSPAPQRSASATIIFTGNMGYGPNRLAVRWFVERCLPLIARACPDARLVVVGARPPRDVRALAGHANVSVRGFVRSMADALREATVAVAPIQSGAGMQNKILEAMATGLPVVTTPCGLGTIAATTGRHVLVAETSNAFADAVVTLLRDPDLAARIGRSAREYVAAHHSWEASAQRVESIYESLLN